MVDNVKIGDYCRLLNFDNCVAALNGKIWLFWSNALTLNVVSESCQAVTIGGNSVGLGTYFMTVVYAKCTKVDR